MAVDCSNYYWVGNTLYQKNPLRQISPAAVPAECRAALGLPPLPAMAPTMLVARKKPAVGEKVAKKMVEKSAKKNAAKKKRL